MQLVSEHRRGYGVALGVASSAGVLWPAKGQCGLRARSAGGGSICTIVHLHIVGRGSSAIVLCSLLSFNLSGWELWGEVCSVSSVWLVWGAALASTHAQVTFYWIFIHIVRACVFSFTRAPGDEGPLSTRLTCHV